MLGKTKTPAAAVVEQARLSITVRSALKCYALSFKLVSVYLFVQKDNVYLNVPRDRTGMKILCTVLTFVYGVLTTGFGSIFLFLHCKVIWVKKLLFLCISISTPILISKI